MFYIILFLLTFLWSGYQEALPNDVLHYDFLTFFGNTYSVRESLIFLLLLSMALTFPKVFREIALALILVWTLPLYNFSQFASLSSAIGFGGFTIFIQKPKQKIFYVKKKDGLFIEGYI